MNHPYLIELSKYLFLNKIIPYGQILTKDNYNDFVKLFQKKLNLDQTGLTDATTLWKLQYPFVTAKPEYSIEHIDVDMSKDFDCLPGFNIRNDIYDPLQSAFNDIHHNGGLVFSSGSLRPLDAEVTPARSHTSLHYTGIALDLCINAGFTDPKKDPYVIVREKFDTHITSWTDKDVYFRIYCRSQQGSNQKLKGIYWENHKSGVDLYQEVEDKFICITDIMQQHGFTAIPPRPGFLATTDRDYLSSEWWHFNGKFDLVHGFSLFGIELIKTFGLEKVADSPVWDFRRAIFDTYGFLVEDYIDPDL